MESHAVSSSPRLPEQRNPFDRESVAARYADGRPRHHAEIIARIKALLSVTGKLGRALDVGCGTGLSTQALLEVADRVDGIDSSEAMVAAAEASEELRYSVASAEALPYPDACFDLITVSSALHWFDRDRFLAEAARVLRDGARLVIYENGFPGVMLSNPDFQAWARDYYSRFPGPPRDRSPLTDDAAADYGMQFVARRQYSNVVEFSLPELSLYLSTQTNAIEAIENGTHTVDSLRRLTEQEAAEFFPKEAVAPFEFAGFIWVLQKNGILR